jgi:KamA family protein
MIAVSTQSNQTKLQDSALSPPTALPAWQSALAQAITDPAELIAVLGLNSSLLPAAQVAAQLFPLRVPRGFVARMEHGNPDDPLLRQVLPLDAESLEISGFVADPVGDIASRIAPGVLHKYHGRALLVSTGACGVHCRYCFRRHFPYGEETASSQHWRVALAAIKNDKSIRELILSGGDPLSLNERRLRELSEGISHIPHLKRLRIHTRQPIVLPERVDDEFLSWLDSIALQKVMVLHVNHPNELSTDVIRVCQQLTQHGVTLLNQSVLLKGVNDSAEVLIELSESLFDAGIQPYYLHLLDRVQGAAHFEVIESTAQTLMRLLIKELPGFLVPKLVREVPGYTSKSPVAF